MKIALIHHQLAHGGGMETYFVDLIAELTAQGHKVDVLVARSSSDFKLPPNVKVQIFSSRLFPKFLRKLHFFYQIKSYLSKHIYDLSISTTRAYARDMIITGGTHKGYMKSHHRFYPRDFLEAWLEHKAYHAAKKIVAHSPKIKNELIELYGIHPTKIFMRYPPVHSEKFSFKPHTPRHPFRLLFVSTSHVRKGGFLLLKALKDLPADAFELIIAGRPFKQAHTLKQKVTHLGYVHDMAPVYHQADLLLLPSYFEPFGLVVAQALECGTPVLISSRCGVTELVAPEEGLILREQSAPALQKLLLQAKQTQFEIRPNFVTRNDLDLIEHVRALLKYALLA